VAVIEPRPLADAGRAAGPDDHHGIGRRPARSPPAQSGLAVGTPEVDPRQKRYVGRQRRSVDTGDTDDQGGAGPVEDGAGLAGSEPGVDAGGHRYWAAGSWIRRARCSRPTPARRSRTWARLTYRWASCSNV